MVEVIGTGIVVAVMTTGLVHLTRGSIAGYTLVKGVVMTTGTAAIVLGFVWSNDFLGGEYGPIAGLLMIVSLVCLGFLYLVRWASQDNKTQD